MEPESDTQVLYEDDDVRVIGASGESDFVVVTFGDMITKVDGNRFFADTPLRKLGISAIGLVAKRSNWYPAETLRKASAAILARAGRYSTRVIYGGSMGGYAAIKFSRLLGATHVIALCPQWSIDPAECDGVNPGWGEYFTPAMRGMGIRAEDVAGEVFLFSDSMNARDAFHCRRILEHCPDAHFTNVPMVGHHVTTVFASTSNLMQLIRACRARDVIALRAFSRRTRRGHPALKRNILRRAVHRHPRLGVSLLAETGPGEFLPEKQLYLPFSISHLASTAGAEQAIAHYESLRPMLVEPHRQYLICSHLVGLTGGRVAVATSQASSLIYDLSKDMVRHRSAPFEPWEFPVEVEFLPAGAALFVTIGGTRFRLARGEKGQLHVPPLDARAEAASLFDIGAGAKGQFTIRCGGRYLSAERTGRVSCNRDSIKASEGFFFFGPAS